jgi:hypothetical protein
VELQRLQQEPATHKEIMSSPTAAEPSDPAHTGSKPQWPKHDQFQTKQGITAASQNEIQNCKDKRNAAEQGKGKSHATEFHRSGAKANRQFQPGTIAHDQHKTK